MRIQVIKIMLLVAGFWLLASGCDPNRVFEDNTDLPGFAWEQKNKLSFDVDITDTTALHNLYVNVRHASHYPYANLYVFVTIKFPNGKTSRDTVFCPLADDAGEWLGEGMGDIWDNQVLWKPKVKFPLAGKYNFEYEHAMRMDPVPFIMDMGLRVEKEDSK